MEIPISDSPSFSVEEALEYLRSAIGSLDADKEDGFEGLLATVLSDFTKTPVRIAKNGYQFGHDMVSVQPDAIISIEAKLYETKLRSEPVLAKLPQWMQKDTKPDLWVLGTIADAGAGLSETLYSFASTTGVAIEILDWPSTSQTPPLAAYCMLSPVNAQEFIVKHGKIADRENVLPLVFAVLKSHLPLLRASRGVAQRLTAPSIGMAMAQQANAEWLFKRLSSNDKAQAAFGQKLAPYAPNALPLQPRTVMTTEIANRVFAPEAGAPVFIVGSQGSGKSWAIMKAWKDTATAPLMITLTAQHAAMLEQASDPTTVIIDACLRQTGSVHPELERPRWQRRFARWRANPNCGLPRFVLFTDGLNQRPGAPWIQILHQLQEFCSETGGQLVATVRPGLYRRLKNRLPPHDDPVSVDRWSDDELSSILLAKSVDADNLSPDVLETLRTPRMTGLAFDLLAAGTIKGFNYLTPGRLLHAQIYSGDDFDFDPEDFARYITAHSQLVLDRTRNQHDDPILFGPADAGGLSIAERLQLINQDGYFNALASAPTNYEIRQGTLSLGLAIGLVQKLRRASETRKDIRTVCANTIEPIQAVDDTPAIVVDAIILTASDPDCPAEIIKELVSVFCDTQNPDHSLYPAFCAAACLKPEAFLSALSECADISRAAFNHDWLLGAIATVAEDLQHRSLLSDFIIQCLRQHSLSPKISASGSNDEDPSQDDLDRRQIEIESQLRELSSAERSILQTMERRDDLGSYGLADDALWLMRLLPLADFVPAWVGYVLAKTINSPRFYRSHSVDLFRFNTFDWHETREQILSHAELLLQAGPSTCGKWTIVHILDATGNPDDAGRAETIRTPLLNPSILKLTRERKKKATPDACDPLATPDPDLIALALDQLRNLNTSNWRPALGLTREDSQIRELLPVLARFSPDDALTFQRQLASELLTRSGFPLRMATFSLYPEASALNMELEEALLELALDVTRHPKEDRKSKPGITQQFLLLTALNSRSGDDQIETLGKLTDETALITNFDDIMMAPSPEIGETSLLAAAEAGQRNTLITALRFASKCGSSMTCATLALCETLARSENTLVRAFAMRALARSQVPEVLERFARTGWSAADLEGEQTEMERWYGSFLLLEAIKSRCIRPEEIIDRITPKHYSALVTIGGENITTRIAKIVDPVIRVSIADNPNEEPPLLLRKLTEELSEEFPYVDLEERRSEPKDLRESLKALSETDTDYMESQKAQAAAYKRFRTSLQAQGADTLLNDLGYQTFAACATAAPDTVYSWAEYILKSRGWTRRAVKVPGLHIARTLSSARPDISERLFSALLTTDNFLQLHYGRSKLNYEAVYLWLCADIPAIKKLCYLRLDHCCDDRAIFRETLSALKAHREDLVRDYIAACKQSGHAMQLARALTVAAFFEDERPFVEAHVTAAGPVGIAARKSEQSLRRLASMLHWWNEMAQAPDRGAFWRASKLFRSCVDGRIDVAVSNQPLNDVARRFLPLLSQDINNAINNSQNDLKKTLFGAHPPDRWFSAGPQRGQEGPEA